jgi:hydroxymethylglutaryl-CoA reductase
MRLHARQVAVAAGATDEQIEWLAEQLVRDQIIRSDNAEAIWKEGSASKDGGFNA